MATPSEQLAAGLAKVRKAWGESVTYFRGSAEIALTEVVPGSKVFRFTDEHGTTKHIQTSDFLVEAAQLQISGTAIEPRIGDRIRQTVGSHTITFLVSSINNEPCFRPSDRQGQTQFRIHTIKNKTENA